MPEKAIKVRVFGRVQGVGYRSWTSSNAQKYGLIGWVRNRVDGSVEALFVGEESVVQLLVEQCRKGPPAARVEKVETEDALGIVDKGFRQLPTV
jgi:acylphosphatase